MLEEDKIKLEEHSHAEGFSYDEPDDIPEGTIMSVSSISFDVVPSSEENTKIIGVVADSAGIECAVGPLPLKPVIMLGRAKVRVVGPVEKGQAIATTSEPGVGGALPDNKGKLFGGIVGYSLVNDPGDSERLVQCVIMPK